MSTDPHLDPTARPDRSVQGAHAANGGVPRHDTVAYEARDVQVRSIYWYLIALTVSVAASFFICIYVLRYTERFVSRHESPMMPARAAKGPDYRVISPAPGLHGV